MNLVTYLNFMGEDFIAKIEFEVTSPPRAAIIDHVYGGEPPEGPEWDVDSIHLMQDFPGHSGAPFEATGALFNHLCEFFSDDIAQYIYDNYDPTGWID